MYVAFNTFACTILSFVICVLYVCICACLCICIHLCSMFVLYMYNLYMQFYTHAYFCIHICAPSVFEACSSVIVESTTKCYVWESCRHFRMYKKRQKPLLLPNILLGVLCLLSLDHSAHFFLLPVHNMLPFSGACLCLLVTVAKSYSTYA